MADPLYELLVPYLNNPSSPHPVPTIQDPVTAKYLARLSALPLASLATTEPQSLAQSSHSTLLSLQSLAARSNGAIIASADHLSSLSQALPLLAAEAKSLQDGIPKLDEEVVAFATKYSRNAENGVLDWRKRALMMARNVDRLSDILDLPTLLSSAISSSTVQGASSTLNYASALDLHSHIKRLHVLHRDSALIASIHAQSEAAMREMTTSLIASLRVPNIKLAAAMRTIGWLRRIAPELDSGNFSLQSTTTSSPIASANREGNPLGSLFLVCRLATLVTMLGALSPLRDLADQETVLRQQNSATTTTAATRLTSSAWSGGQQTERYLKRYIEIFREQSFAIISMYKSIFPSSLDTPAPTDPGPKFRSLALQPSSPHSPPPQHRHHTPPPSEKTPLSPLPSPLSTFPLHLLDLLVRTLDAYLPNVRDRASRESLLTQVLYCAGSLGRLGGDFSLVLGLLAGVGSSASASGDGDGDGEEWVEVVRKHRVLAGKLEVLARGGGGGMGKGGG